MNGSPRESFAEPASFVARYVRRNGMHSFLFTSARHGEGTTTTVLGVAGYLSSFFGMRVLALELNPGAGGFQDRLNSGSAPFRYTGGDPASLEYYQAAAGYKLLSIGGANGGHVGEEADSTMLLTEFLGSSDGRFDVILIDAPPVLEKPDAITAAAGVDGIIVVVEAGRTRLEMLRHIRGLFDREDVQLLGGMLTKQRYIIPNWLYRVLFQ